MAQEFFKIFNSDYTSPIQGGKALWDGTVPFQLPEVRLDGSGEECGAGWNFVDSIATGFKIAGMWKTGRPSIVAIVEPSKDLIQRNNKWRSSGLRITGVATEVQIAQGIELFSEVFGKFKAEMASEQIAWRYALGRPENNQAAVVRGLEDALTERDLRWAVKEYKTARDAWATWDAWATRDAWDAWDAWATRDAWAARAARAARDALAVFFSSKNEWVKTPALKYTIGLRDAYTNGLAIALPTEENVLGYSMKEGE